MNRTLGAISGENLRAERNRLGLTADELADRCADEGLTAPVIRNIESGRRRLPATISEWLSLSYALGVPPEVLLLPDPATEVEIVAGVTVTRTALLQWIRGQQPLPGTDERHYRQIAAIALPADTHQAAERRAELTRRVTSMLDLVDDTASEISRAARAQVYDLLAELQSLLTTDTPRAQVIEKIESYKDRITELA
jgi:transcriptional regulator with XRE-family HTH domain